MSLRDFALATSIVLLWGANFIVMKYAVAEVPPFLLVATRFIVSAVPAILFVPRPKTAWRLVVAYGVLFGIGQFAPLFTAFKLGSPAGLTAVVLQTQALFTIAYAHLLLGERTTHRQRTGLVIAALGVVTIGVGAAQSAAVGVSILPLLLVIGAAASWGLGNVALRRVAATDVLGFVIWSSLVPPLPMLALSYATEGPSAWASSWHHLTWLGVLAVLYVAWPVGVLSGWAWGSLLSRHAAARFAPIALLVPVVSLGGGALVYGERPSPWAIAGSGLILAGLAVAITGRRSGKSTVVEA